ncbi:MAG: hypothetical protein ABIX37_00355 [Gammaproteobacteria bacterium]
MLIRIVAILSLTLSASVLADAGSGDFMGCQLGGRYQRDSATSQQVTTTGNLIILAAQPVKPGDIAEVSLLTTPSTLTIGNITASQWFLTEEEGREFARKYFKLLRARYPGWSYGSEVMDARMNIVEVSFRESPYDLWLRLTKDVHEGKDMWRFSMTLRWLPDSAQGRAWRALSGDEQVAAKKDADQLLLKGSDLRGI